MTAICGGRYHGKYRALKKQYDKKTQDLTNSLGEVGRLKIKCDDAENEIKALNGAISNHIATEFFGRNNLTWIEEIPSVASQEFIHHAKVMVIGQDKDCGFYFIVKVFQYQLNDPEDRDFAIREAEELIETIKKF